MPLYDYQCSQCQKVTEVRHGFDETHTDPCPACGGPLARLFNPAGIVFKGSGFYVTDSRTASEKKPGEKKSGESEKSSASTPPAKPSGSGGESAA